VAADVLTSAARSVGFQLKYAPLAADATGLYCWSRATGTAEVDHLARMGARVRPIEVKSGASGRPRSLHLLLKEQPDCAPGIVMSQAPYDELPEQGLVFCPLYRVGSLTEWTDCGVSVDALSSHS
jgi:predicted AAA+ superfamily ATPase